MTAVGAAFTKAAGEGRAVLVGYLPAGFPSVDGAIEAGRAMADAGADVIEIGLPYTDPLLDGPVVQAAMDRALAGALQVGKELGPGALLLVNLSGRGDKDVATASKWFGHLSAEALDAAVSQ